MATNGQRIEVVVHTLAGGSRGAEYAPVVVLGAEMTRESELRRQREMCIAHGWRNAAIEIETEICYLQRNGGAA